MLARLKGRKRNERVQRKGQYWRGAHVTAKFLFECPSYATCTEPTVFLGCKTSTKLAKRAVDRNRIRRRCKEAMRLTLPQCQKIPTVQLLLAPKSSSLEAPFTELLADVNDLLTTILNRYERQQTS